MFLKIDTKNKKVDANYINRLLTVLKYEGYSNFDRYKVFKTHIKIHFNYSMDTGVGIINKLTKKLNEVE